jgi:hypothetical protein
MPAPFSTGAVAAVVKRSSGIPRLVNAICDNALTLAFADASEMVTEEHVESAARDLRLVPRTVSASAGARLTAPPVTPSPAARQPDLERAATASFTRANRAAPNGKVAAVEFIAAEATEPVPMGDSQKSVLGRWAAKMGLGRNSKNA